jgi:transcriptional regulator with XRE-family HTH domain
MKLGRKRLSAVLRLRKQLGLNQSEFWACVGVSQSGGSRYEQGRAVPRPVIMLLELAYGNKPQVLLKQMRGWK